MIFIIFRNDESTFNNSLSFLITTGSAFIKYTKVEILLNNTQFLEILI